MAKRKSKKEIDAWISRINRANKSFDKWRTRFKCKTLEEYYEGYQWRNLQSDDSFVMNLFFSVWQTKQPSLLFKKPSYQFSPKPTVRDWDPEISYGKASLATDLVNTLIEDPKMDYAENCGQALLDIGAYFGVVEIGYSANWMRNPNIGQPIVNKDYDESVETVTVKEPDSEPDEIPEEEWLFVKRIPAHRFRVGGNDQWKLENCAWSGYYQYIRAIDIKKLTNKDVSYSGDAYVEENKSDNPETDLHKVWTICDHKKMEIFMIDETACEHLGDIEEVPRVPFKVLRFFKRRKGFYPIPFFWNWKSNQDEVNESLEQLRAHRRRSKRVYQAVTGQVDEEEKQKFASAPDMTIIEVHQREAITPVQNASVDNTIVTSYQISKDNFNVASGTGAENLGDVDRVTATQASITAQVGSVRQASERETVATWLCDIGLEILQQAIERFTLPVWIKKSLQGAQAGETVSIVSQEWELMSTDTLEGTRYVPDVDVSSLSPLDNEEQKRNMMEFYATLNQYPQFALHPELIRELASKFNYKNEKVIRALQEMATLSLMGMKAQLEQAVGGIMGQGSNMAQNTVEQATPPTQGEIETQLAGQGVPVT